MHRTHTGPALSTNCSSSQEAPYLMVSLDPAMSSSPSRSRMGCVFWTGKKNQGTVCSPFRPRVAFTDSVETHLSLLGYRLGFGRNARAFRVPAPKKSNQRAQSSWEVQFKKVKWGDVRPGCGSPQGSTNTGRERCARRWHKRRIMNRLPDLNTNDHKTATRPDSDDKILTLHPSESIIVSDNTWSARGD